MRTGGCGAIIRAPRVPARASEVSLRGLATIALLVAGALACDLTTPLPASPEGPHVDRVEPATGFAGQLVRVRGRGFDLPARTNLVWFGNVAASGVDVDADGALVVAVPDLAASGPVAVETRRGRSDPASWFEFGGPGHLRKGEVETRQRVLLDAVDAVVFRGEIFIVSVTLNALVSSAGRTVALPGGEPFHLIVPLADSGLVIVESAAKLYLVDLETAGIVGNPIEVPGALSAEIVSPDSATRAWFAFAMEDGSMRVQPVDLVEGGLVLSEPLALGLGDVLYVEANPETPWVSVAGRVSATGGNAGSYAIEFHREGHETELVKLPDESVYVVHVTVGDRSFVALDDGAMLVLDLAADPPQWVSRLPAPVPGRLPYAVQPLRVGAEVYVLATFFGFDRMLAIDSKGKVAWSVPVGAPTSFALDRTLGTAYVIDELTSEVEVIDAAAGRSVNRLPFDLGLGDDGGAWQAIAYDAPNRQIVVASERWNTVLRYSADTLRREAALPLAKRTPGGRRVSVPRGLAVSPIDHALWIAHEYELGRVAAGTYTEEIVVEGLPSRGKYLALAPDGSLVLGMLDTVGLYRPGTTGAGLTGSVVVPGLLLDVAIVDGGVLASWSTSSGVQSLGEAAFWTFDELAASKPPSRTTPAREDWTNPVGVVRTLEELLFLSGGGVPSEALATGLGADLRPLASRPSAVTSWGPVAVSPDGARLMWGEPNGQGSLVHVVTLAPGQALVNERQLAVEGSARGIVFDPSGEKAFVLLGGREAIAAFE